jgi:4'-phosphopantetheinyl transferase
MNVIWQPTPKSLKLGDRDVHLWLVNLDLPLEKVNQLKDVLSSDEKVRAERFYFEKHRNRFIVARSTLRIILAQYLEREANKIEFSYGDRGKPFLKEKAPNKKLQFNISHSENLALYGLTYDRAIGVDIEHLRPIDDVQKIARRFYSAQESAIVDSLTDSKKILAFFRGWTAKEAYLKATGDGISEALDRVEVSLAPDETLSLLRLHGDIQAAARWRLHSFTPADQYVATIAIEGSDWMPSYWQHSF